MYGYFFSKIINPHRKCDMYKDLKRSSNNNKLKKTVTDLLDNKDIQQCLKGLKLNSIYEISLYMGHILGEYLYISISSQGTDKFADIVYTPNLSIIDFQNTKERLIGSQNYKEHYKRYF